MSELRVGLVGCGRLAEVGYVPALRRVAGMRLAALVDPDATRRARLANGVASYASAAELVDAGGVDCVVLATPVDAHVSDARLAAAAGIPALVEKPPASDLEGALALGALAPPPRIAFNRRFEPRQEELREAVAPQDELELRLELRYRRRSWRPHTVADDALLDLGPHLIDLARWLAGSDVRTVASTLVTFERADFELELERGRASVSCATDQPHLERIEALGAGDARNARRRTRSALARILARLGQRGEHPLVTSLARQLESFGRAVDGASEPVLGTVADGVAAMAAVDAVRDSAAAGGRHVTVEAPSAV